MGNQPENGILEEFRLEFQACWGRLPNKFPFLLLLAAWVALFQFLGSSNVGYVRTTSLFGYMYNDFTAGGNFAIAEDTHSLIIPFVVVALLWSKRHELLNLDLNPWRKGLAVLFLGLLIHVLGYLVQQSRISVVGFFTGLYGLIGLIWGCALLRAIFFPFFLFGFCVPIGSLADPVTFRLRLLVSDLVGFVSHYMLAIDVSVQGNMLVDPSGHYQYEIAAACSGIHSLIATIALAVILAFVSLRNPWKRLVLIVSALPLAVLGNVVRMLTIVIAAEIGGQEWGAYIHEGGPGGIFSLLPYVPAFLGLLFLERSLERRDSIAEMHPLKPLELKET